jgi:ankyrin repeat protein
MGRRKLVRIILESSQTDLELKNQQKETPLDIATRKNHEEIVTILKNPPPTKSNVEVVQAEINAATNAEMTTTGGLEESKQKSSIKKV